MDIGLASPDDIERAIEDGTVDPANLRVLMFTKDPKWVPAVDPLHFDKPIAGVGLGSTFGRVMALPLEPRAQLFVATG